jgi:hypothetical protein
MVLGTRPHEENPFPQPPSVKQITLFLTWCTRTSRGIIDERITDTTLSNRLACLKRAINLYTKHVYSRADNDRFTHLIEQQLPQTERLSTKSYDKPLAPLRVSKDVLRFLWACDEYRFAHPRARIQLAFSIVILTLTGTRPGEFVESSGWKDTNEGLLYRDVQLFRSSSEDYEGFLLHVQLRNRKGHRHNNKQGYNYQFSLWDKFLTSPVHSCFSLRSQEIEPFVQLLVSWRSHWQMASLKDAKQYPTFELGTLRLAILLACSATALR